MEELAAHTLSLSVKDLVSFVWRRGGLSRSSIGGLAHRARRGTQGHLEIQRSRPPGYEAEVTVRHQAESRNCQLRVHGRIDGVFREARPVALEEIKTVTHRWHGQADELHWAQLRFYAAVYARDQDLDEVEQILTYYNLDTKTEQSWRRIEDRASLDHFLKETTSEYLAWMDTYQEWCLHRNETIGPLPFPFDSVRQGQGMLMDAVSESLRQGNRLFVEAATGLGKSLAILYPVIRALGKGEVTRVFYLSAKNTGKGAALQALALLREQGLKIRSLNLRSKGSTCVREGVPCQVESCPLAKDYYLYRKAAMKAALQYDHLDGENLAVIGAEHNVCPFELALDVGQFVDLVLCDYHYVFDQQMLVDRYPRHDGERWVLLVDECHNLVERGREMYSAVLGTERVQSLHSSIGRSARDVSRALKRFLGHFSGSARGQTQGARRESQQLDFSSLLGGTPDQEPEPTESFASGMEFPTVPASFRHTVKNTVEAIEQWLSLDQETAFRDDLLAFYFELLRFVRCLEWDEEQYRRRISGSPPAFQLLCLDPAKMLSNAMDTFAAVVCFSGTLSPVPTFRRLLGGAENDRCLQLGSPFDSDRLLVWANTRIDTRYRQRQNSLEALANTLVNVASCRQGNYLVFFPSFEYLEQCAQALLNVLGECGAVMNLEQTSASQDRGGGSDERVVEFTYDGSVNPQRTARESVRLLIRCQIPGMSESEREGFLQDHPEYGDRTVIRLVVLGGVFSEAIELSEGSLQGIVVVGVGYPKVSREREMLREYFDGLHLDGMAVAYLVPGMNRVVQAAGRLMRRSSDFGMLTLVDTRYDWAEYQALLPAWWQVQQDVDDGDFARVRHFWESHLSGASEGANL